MPSPSPLAQTSHVPSGSRYLGVEVVVWVGGLIGLGFGLGEDIVVVVAGVRGGGTIAVWMLGLGGG